MRQPPSGAQGEFAAATGAFSTNGIRFVEKAAQQRRELPSWEWKQL
jgi:hypothetical protein